MNKWDIRQWDAPLRYLAYGAILGAFALSLYGRFKGLGSFSLAEDEYHTAQSVRNILRHGLPAFECGGYYPRGLGLQYVLAAAVGLSGLQEEAVLRFVTAALSLLTLPPVYLLGRKLGGGLIGWFGVVLVGLSVWEIETARYVRMYAPFQAVFVWYLFFLHRVIVEERHNDYKWLFLLSILSVLVWEGGVLLVLLNFLPLILDTNRASPRIVVAACAALFATCTYLLLDIRHWGVDTTLIIDVPPAQTFPYEQLGPFDLPKVLAVVALRELGGAVVFVSLLLALSAIGYYIVRQSALDQRTRVSLTLLLVLALFNQYGLIVYSTIFLFLIGWIHIRDMRLPAAQWCALGILGSAAVWTAYGLMTTGWYGLFPVTVDNPLRKLLVVFLKFPDVYWEILHEWWIGQPLTTFVLATAIIVGLLVRRPAATLEPMRLLAAVLLLLGLAVAALRQPYHSSHYTFFLYPLVILLALHAIQRVVEFTGLTSTRKVAVCTLLVTLYLFSSDDYSLRHILGIDQPEVVFRTTYSQDREYHLWNREDYKTPAQFVNERLDPNEIVVATVLPVHFYLKKLDYQYIESTAGEFHVLAACRGTKELWTNANLLYREEDVFRLLETSTAPVWVIVRSDLFPWPSNLEIEVAKRYATKRIYRSVDRAVDVYRIEART